MAIDSNPGLHATNSFDKPVIENELPAYRAISARAVTSLALGLSAVFCFTSLWFLLVVVAAVFFGWTAIRAIHRLPEILTGTGLARAGIGLGLVFGVTATTQVVVQDLLLTYEATQFAKMYVNVLKSDSVALAAWYLQAPEYRKDKTPEEVVEDLKKQKNPATPDVYGTQTEQIRAIKERLKGSNQKIQFSQIERKLTDGLTQYAFALVDLDGPGTKEFPETEQFAMIDLMKAPGAGRSDWRVREVKFPYKPASAALMTEKKDDGHGHSH